MDQVLREIKNLASKYHLNKVMLFGSRARGDHSQVSDYDIAVFAEGFSPMEQANFYADLEEIETLKKIDLIFVDSNIDTGFLERIKEDGVFL